MSQRDRKVARWVSILGLVGVLSAPPNGVVAQANDPDRQAEAIGRAFLQAEAQEWIKTWLNEHPPIEGVEGFGGKALFAVQLLLAADAYFKADTDRGRFHAVLQGAAAVVAYSYSATPAVGIVVTVVYIVATVIEASVTGSYAESILQIQKELVATQGRINDLIFRNGMARATRLLMLVDAAQQIGKESLHADALFAADCATRAGDYDTLSHCSEQMVRAVSLRRLLAQSISRLLSLPDADLAMLKAEDGKPAPTTEHLRSMGKEARAELEAALRQATTRLADLEGLYDRFESAYGAIARELFIDEALEEPARAAALNQLRSQCLVDRTKLSLGASTVVSELATLVVAARSGKRDPAILQEDAQTGVGHALGLLASYEQRKISCPPIAASIPLSLQMSLVRQNIARVQGG